MKIKSDDKEVYIVSPLTVVLIVIAVAMLAAVIALYFVGKKAQKRQEEQNEQLAATAQTVSMLIIDKKKMRLKDSGLPAVVIEQSPKMLRRSKLPIVKAKIGPKVMTLICDASIYDSIPVKKEVKAVVSGLYITDALKRLAKQQEVYAYDFKGHRYDVGSKIGFLQANIEFALRNPEVSGELKEYLDQLHGNMDAMLDYE